MAQPPPQVLDLVQRFDRNREAYRSPHYNDTQVRREFLDPLFKCLGWTREQAAGANRAASEREAWCWLKRGHPGIAAHLEQFGDGLRKRGGQGEFWWELRPCDYYQDLDAPKIIFPDICKEPQQMLTLHQRQAAARTPQAKTALERQIAATDTQLNNLVYSLYGLTDAEIKIVEAS